MRLQLQSQRLRLRPRRLRNQWRRWWQRRGRGRRRLYCVFFEPLALKIGLPITLTILAVIWRICKRKPSTIHPDVQILDSERSQGYTRSYAAPSEDPTRGDDKSAVVTRIFTVEFLKGAIGLNLEAFSSETGLGSRVHALKENSPAAACGLIEKGDRVHKVNKRDVTRETHASIVSLVKAEASVGPVALEFARDEEVLGASSVVKPVAPHPPPLVLVIEPWTTLGMHSPDVEAALHKQQDVIEKKEKTLLRNLLVVAILFGIGAVIGGIVCWFEALPSKSTGGDTNDDDDTANEAGIGTIIWTAASAATFVAVLCVFFTFFCSPGAYEFEPTTDMHAWKVDETLWNEFVEMVSRRRPVLWVRLNAFPPPTPLSH